MAGEAGKKRKEKKRKKRKKKEEKEREEILAKRVTVRYSQISCTVNPPSACGGQRPR
jgi:hypothetical protein